MAAWAAALLLAVPAGLSSCSGGGPAARLAQPGCDTASGEEGLCLVSCNLGCGNLGCAISDIAQNQPIILVFNQDIDPTSVTSASFSLRTATGQEPVGQFLISGSTLTFVPEIQIVGGASFFGFEANETYELRLPAGPNEINAIRSVSGDVLAEETLCSLAVSRGVVDLDGEPPVAELRSPSSKFQVAPGSSIALEFSEIIDATPFLSAPFGSEPVQVFVSRLRPGPNGQPECDPTSTPAPVRGQWLVTNDIVQGVSRASFVSSQQLPGNICVSIVVTTSVRDLSGRPSRGQTFEYFTDGQIRPPVLAVEDFDDLDMFDPDNSSGTWLGGVTPGELGWDGLHGEFRPQDGVNRGPGVFEWNTDNQVIPRSRTLSGEDEVVTDGVFRFSRFRVPSSFTVRFVGDAPATIFVRGKAEIEGVLDLAGGTLVEHDGTNPFGQAGASGAAGGGAGGRGADKGDGVANQPRFNGGDGEALQLPNGRAYGTGGELVAGVGPHTRPGFSSTSFTQAEGTPLSNPLTSGTGGKGSLQFPLSGSNTEVVPGFSIFSVQLAAGGGGGGYMTRGRNGQAVQVPNNLVEALGPPGVGGERFVFPPLPASDRVIDHYLVGGAGGGGAGTHPFFFSQFEPDNWRSGSGGGGGGGAVALRIGGEFAVGTAGVIDVSGGSTQASENNSFSSPGGGGSGGTVLVQAGQIGQLDGLIDVSGGIGGTTTGGFVSMTAKGGDGGTGYIRVEAPGPVPSDPTEWTGTIAPANAAQTFSLTEQDPVTGVQSRWYRSGGVFPPAYDYYVVEATIDGVDVTFSDDPSRGTLASGTAVQLFVQGADEDGLQQIDPATIRPWRRYVGSFAPLGERALTDDSVTAYRFLLLFDRTLATDIVVHRVEVQFRPL